MRPSKPPTSNSGNSGDHGNSGNSRTIEVQIGQHTFVGIYVRPGCPPALPAEYRFSHRVVQKRSGEWCFLPLIYDTVPESWCCTREDRAFRDSGFPETAPPVSKTVNQSRLAPEYSEIGHALTEDGIEESVSVGNPPHPAMQIRTTKMQEAKNTSFSDHKPALRCAEVITGSQACTEVCRSDHPIPNDHPISSEERPAAEVMNNIEEEIAKHLICSPHQRTVLALWILHTYCSIASATTPYLNIYSHVEQSGKSTCLGFLRAYSAQPWFASGVPASTLTRKIIADQPTVLLDNWHTTFRGAISIMSPVFCSIAASTSSPSASSKKAPCARSRFTAPRPSPA